jgi:hypothetical protein
MYSEREREREREYRQVKSTWDTLIIEFTNKIIIDK